MARHTITITDITDSQLTVLLDEAARDDVWHIYDARARRLEVGNRRDERWMINRVNALAATGSVVLGTWASLPNGTWGARISGREAVLPEGTLATIIDRLGRATVVTLGELARTVKSEVGAVQIYHVTRH